MDAEHHKVLDESAENCALGQVGVALLGAYQRGGIEPQQPDGQPGPARSS
jgi:hypothetical protein